MDVLIAAIQSLVSAITALLGVHLSLNPTQDASGRRKMIISFLVLAVLATGLSIAQAVVNRRAQNEGARQFESLRDTTAKAQAEAIGAQREAIGAQKESMAAREEAGRARQEVVSARSEASLRDESAKKDRDQLLSEVRATKAELQPFVELAKRRYPDLAPDEALNRLARELEVVKNMASPPTLQLRSYSTSAEDGKLVGRLVFEADKNEPLGQIQFLVALPVDSTARILDLQPDANFGAFQSGEGSKRIAPDGLSARYIYSLLPGGTPALTLTLSSAARVRISGNYMRSSVEAFITAAR